MQPYAIALSEPSLSENGEGDLDRDLIEVYACVWACDYAITLSIPSVVVRDFHLDNYTIQLNRKFLGNFSMQNYTRLEWCACISGMNMGSVNHMHGFG